MFRWKPACPKLEIHPYDQRDTCLVQALLVCIIPAKIVLSIEKTDIFVSNRNIKSLFFLTLVNLDILSYLGTLGVY